MDRSARARQRIKIDPVPVRFLAEGQEAVGCLTEISRAGVFLETEEFPRKGAVIVFQFRAPNGEIVDVRGEVRWRSDGTGGEGDPRGFGVLLREAPLSYREFFLWAQTQADKEDAEQV
jgi:hypothetical protein